MGGAPADCDAVMWPKGMEAKSESVSVAPCHTPGTLASDGGGRYRGATARNNTRIPEKQRVAGHSQFKNIMHRKGAQDAKRARAFAKLIREITVSARQGLPDPAFNPRLRSAVQAARVAN